MAYTEYLDVVIRNQGRLDALDKRIKNIRNNLDAINGGATAAAAPRASDQLDSRSVREVRQESRRNLARDRVRIASPSRQLAQAVRGVEQALESVQEQAVDRLNDVAEQITQGGRRGGRRGGSFRRQPAGGGGSGGPPDDPDRFRRRVGQVQTRERFAERYGPQLPDANAAERSLAYQARLNAQVRQYSGQLIKARQIVGPARQEVERISRAWEEAGGAQIRSLTLAQAYSRELRALNTEQVQARAINQFVERGPGQRALIEGRARAVANELPEAQRPALLDSVRTRLRAQEEALDQGNRSEAFQQEKLAAQEIALRRQEVAESKRAERRARAPQQARVAADKALRLSRQANDIEIPRGTPLGDELYQQSATIAEQSSRQRQALQRSIRSGTATVESVRALTNNINELRSAFETLKVRAQPLQQAARDATRRTEAELSASRRNGPRSAIGGSRTLENSPAFLRSEAQRLERQRRAEIRNGLSSPLRGGETFPDSPAFLEAERKRAERQRRAEIRNAPSQPIGGGSRIEDSPAFVRAQGVRDRQKARAAERQRRAEIRNAVSSPIRGGATFRDSPIFAEERVRQNGAEARLLQQQRDRARRLGGSRDADIQKRQQDELTAFQKSIQSETQLLQQQRDRARKLGQERDKGIQQRQESELTAFQKSVRAEEKIAQGQRDQARKLGQSRDAAIQKRQRDELTAFQKSIQSETQLQQQQRDRARKLGQERDKGIQARQREEEKAFQSSAENEAKILRQQRDRARKLGQSRDNAIERELAARPERQAAERFDNQRLARQSVSLRRDFSTTRTGLQGLAANPALNDQQRAAAANAVKVAEASIAGLKSGQVGQDRKSLQLEQDTLKVLKSQTGELKAQLGVADRQAKAQREEVSAGAFRRNIGRVLGGGGDTQDFESIALGAGFPLLFGGGPGSVAGGVLGSFVGKGFGGQILGGAIGQIVDDLVASTGRLGNALSLLTGDFSALRAEGVRVSAALELQIKERKAAGDFAGAEQQLRTAVGAQQGDVDGLGLENSTAQVNALSAAWDKIYKTVGVTVGIIASPFLAALSAILEVANGIFLAFNAAATGLGALLNLIPGAKQVGDFISQSAFESTSAYQEQLAAIQATNDELVRRGAIEQRLDVQRSAASGLTGASKVLADAQIAAKEKELALDEEIRKIREDAPLNEKLAGKTEQTVGIKQQQFLKNQQQEALRTQIAADAASLQTARELEDRERSRNRETEALLRRQEDLAQAQVDQARQEFDLQRSIADFRIRIEDQIASKRADAIRQELEIAKIRGQIEDSQISSGFDRQIEAAPNDQSARILRAAKEEELARKALERTIRDGRIETTLRIDQIERQSRQEQRALENERIALERQRDSVIRARIGLERQTEDLKRDTADYQLSIARQIEDSAIRAANELRAAAAGLLQGLGGGANLGELGQEVLSGFDRIRGATSFRTRGTSGVREAISPDGGNEYFDFNGATREAVASRIAVWTKQDWTAAITTALGEGKPGNDVFNVIANIAARSAKEPSSRVADLVTRPQQYVANAKRGLNINNIDDPAFGRKLFGARFDELFKRVAMPTTPMPSGMGSSGQLIGMTGGRPGSPNAGISTGPHTDIRFADGRPISAADVDRFLSIGGRVPSSFPVTSGYGPRRAPAPGASTFHRGIDFATPEGLSVALKGGATFAGSKSPAQSGGGGLTGIINTPMGQMQILHMERVLNMPSGAAMPSRAAIPGIGVGTAPFDLKAQEARDKQLQRDRQRLDEELQLDILRRREEDTLQEVIGENSIVRKREELTLATRIADAGIQGTETEQKLLELRIASTREQEILAATVAQLGPINAERQAALDKGLANKREELRIAEALLEIEKQRGFLQDLVNTQREIQNLTTGIDAGFGVGTQASAAFAGVKSRDGTDAQARAQADAVRTLTLLQETIQDAQSIGSSIGDGIRNALISSVTGGDIGQAFGAMFATIGNTLIQSALRPIEQLITDQAFNLLRPNLTQELVASQQIIAAQQNVLAGTLMQQAATQFMIAAQMLTAQQLSGIAGQGFGLAGQLVGSLFSGAGPVSFPSGGLATNIITDLFTGALGFAGGGNPPIGQPSWVGEQGPELSVARGLSTIIPNETSNRLWDSLSNPGAAPDEGGMGGGEVAISYDGPTLVFDSTEYVQKADVPKIVDRAVKQSFGYSQQRMRNSPADRRAAGMR